MRERQRALSRKARSLGWVPNIFGEVEEQLDCQRAGGVLNPCARESNAQTRRCLRENMISDLGLFSCYESQPRATNGQDWWGVSRDAQGFGRGNAVSRASLAKSRLPPPQTSVFQFSFVLHYLWTWEIWACWSTLIGA